jgi:hypothetical protein
MRVDTWIGIQGWKHCCHGRIHQFPWREGLIFIHPHHQDMDYQFPKDVGFAQAGTSSLRRRVGGARRAYTSAISFGNLHYFRHLSRRQRALRGESPTTRCAHHPGPVPTRTQVLLLPTPDVGRPGRRSSPAQVQSSDDLRSRPARHQLGLPRDWLLSLTGFGPGGCFKARTLSTGPNGRTSAKKIRRGCTTPISVWWTTVVQQSSS